ncbi:hypothetical protein V2W38_26605 [Mycolicibacterium fortuitum subsp. fortuitum]|uniref:hypothetical protein n=1 Tax=Mycolicibacterium fortuitum TaxID=1766 RepID=UPI00103F80E1|nr:hypothetical protein [Mycolicibacterium fortuitum]
MTAASVVAVAPITAPLPEAQPPTISSASVQLTASSFVDPVTRWGEVLTTTQTNLQRIVDAASANPFPVLNQIIANQTRYANTIGTALSSGADGLYKFATGTGAGDLPALVATAQDALAHGDAKGAAQQISYALTGLGFALFPTLPILSIPGQITQNIANVAMLIAAQGLNTGIIGKPAFGLLSLAQTSIGVTGAIAQSLVDAATAGDPVAAVSTIVNAPADFTDAMLNGQLIIRRPPWPPTRSVGILTPSGFTYWTPAEALFVKIPQAIAAAITPPASPTALAAPDENATATAASTPDASPQLDNVVGSTLEPTESEATPTEADGPTTPVKVSSNGATDLSAGNKAEPGKTGTTASRPAQQIRTSVESAANEVNKGLNDIRQGIEKSVTGLKERVNKKATTSKASSSAKDGASSSDSDN